MMPTEKSLKQIENELKFIRCTTAGMITQEFEAQDEIIKSVDSALCSLEEIHLYLQPDCEYESIAPPPRELEGADLADKALLVATRPRNTERVRSFLI